MVANNKPSRMVVVDALRGFALAGVALVHFTEQYIAGPAPEGFLAEVNGPVDQVLQGLVFALFSGKFYAIFSMLFGLSFFIQMDSAERRGEDFSLKFIWRAVLLFVIGYVHQLFYRGDIVTIYALLAPFLVPFHRMSSRAILITAAIFLLGLPRLLMFIFLQGYSAFGLPDFMGSPLEAQYYDVLKNGSLLEVFAQNAVYGMQTKFDFQLGIFGRLYTTFGYFLLGHWLGKIQLFREVDERRRAVRKALLWSAAAFLLSSILTGVGFSFVSQPLDFHSWPAAVLFLPITWTNVSLASVIVCGFLLLYTKTKGRWQRRLDFFAPYGRLALTNYLGQSLIGTFLLFGWGLGFLGELRTLYTIILAIVVIALQTLASKYWLRTYHYGPLEWLWRSGTHLKWQRFRKTAISQ